VPDAQFGVPIGLSNTGAFFLALSSANYQLAKDLYLNASVGTELSNEYSFYEVSVSLTHRF
jgi:hypothetical protein